MQAEHTLGLAGPRSRRHSPAGAVTASALPGPELLTLAAVAVSRELHAGPALAHKPAFRVHAVALARGAQTFVNIWEEREPPCTAHAESGRGAGRKSTARTPHTPTPSQEGRPGTEKVILLCGKPQKEEAEGPGPLFEPCRPDDREDG